MLSRELWVCTDPKRAAGGKINLQGPCTKQSSSVLSSNTSWGRAGLAGIHSKAVPGSLTPWAVPGSLTACPRVTHTLSWAVPGSLTPCPRVTHSLPWSSGLFS